MKLEIKNNMIKFANYLAAKKHGVKGGVSKDLLCTLQWAWMITPVRYRYHLTNGDFRFFWNHKVDGRSYRLDITFDADEFKAKATDVTPKVETAPKDRELELMEVDA